MDDLVKIYDTRRGTSWVEGKGYGTVSGTRSGRSGKKGGGNNWSSILTSLKKLGSSNSSTDKTQSSPNTAAHNYYMPFSVIPVETVAATTPSSSAYHQHQHQKYRSLSVATANPYLRHSSPHLNHHPPPPPSIQSHQHQHRQGIIDYSMHPNEQFSPVAPFRSRTVRSPKSNKRSSLFDSTWEPLSQHHPHLRPPLQQIPQSHIHGSCTCSQSTTPVRGGLSNRYPSSKDHSMAIYSEGGSEKMHQHHRPSMTMSNGGVSSSRRSTNSTNCTESRGTFLCESGKKLIGKQQYSGQRTNSPDLTSTVLGNKLSRSAYTTLGGGFMRALRKNSNSKDPFNSSPASQPTKPVTAYDLIEQQFGRQIEDDDDLSDNIIESSSNQYPESISASTLPSNSKKKLMIKRGSGSVSQSYSRFVNHNNHHPERDVLMSAKDAEDLLTTTSNLNLRIGGQGVTLNPWNQTMPNKSKIKSSPSNVTENIKNNVSNSSDSQMKQKKDDLEQQHLNEVEIVENYSVPEPDYDFDDEETSDDETRTKRQQPQFSRRDDNHDKVEFDHPSSIISSSSSSHPHHHPDQVTIQRETATTSGYLSHKDNLLSNGSNALVNTTSTSSFDENVKSVKKSILKKFTLDPSKSQLDSSDANPRSDVSNCNDQVEGIENDTKDYHETNEGIGNESSFSELQTTSSNTKPQQLRKVPRTNMMNKLKRKVRKHVTFRSLPDDTLMLEQINEPIMEEEEPLYDDVDEFAENGISSSSTVPDPSSRRMSSYSSPSSSSTPTPTTTTSTLDEANDQNNHHSHTNSPSIGSTSGGNVENSDHMDSSSKELNLNTNKNEKSNLNQNKKKKDSQIKNSYSALDSFSRNKSFVANHHEAIISGGNVIPGAISNGSNERILIDPSFSSFEMEGENRENVETTNKRDNKNASIIYKASFYPDPVEYDLNDRTNPNKDINSRGTRSPHDITSSFPFSTSSVTTDNKKRGEMLFAQQQQQPPPARNRKKSIDPYPREGGGGKEEALNEFSHLKHSQEQILNENNSRDHFNHLTHNEVDNDEEGLLSDDEDEEEEEDKYNSHKSTFTVSVVNRIDRTLCSDSSSSNPSVGRSNRVGNMKKQNSRKGGAVGNESLKCECNKIIIDVSSGNVYETIQGQDQEHIYEEVGLMNNKLEQEEIEPDGKKSIFDGASKDEILEYLEDAKERVDVLINSGGGNINSEDGRIAPHREVMMSPEMRVNEVRDQQGKEEEKENDHHHHLSKRREVDDHHHDGVIDAVTGEGSRKKRGSSLSPPSSLLCKSRSGVTVSAENLIESTITSSSRRNRTSNVSNSSTDSAVTTSSSLEDESSLRSGPLITSSVSLTQLVERNDSGVGTETSSRPTRLRRSSSAIVGESEQRCTDCEQVFDPVQYDEPSVSGFTSFFPLTCNKCDKKRSERREIISEFVETEFKYGRDLRIIREEFYRPVEVAGLLSKDQIKSIFLNLDELINVNSRFSEKLQDALDIATEQGDEEYTTVNLGRLFMDSSSMLLAFETYCSQQGSASLVLAHLEKEKELLRIFLRVSQMENTLLRRMNLSAFLMVPVQRVTKYPLLLNRLYKVTPYHHRDREALKAAQQKVELHLEHINQQTKSAPNKIWRRISNLSVANRRLPAVLEDIGNMKLRKAALDALKWSREDSSFVLCGKLLFAPVTESSSSSSSQKKGRTIKFLPIHALLVAFGTPTEHYRPDLAETDDPMKTFSSGRTGITDAALVVIKDKSSRYTLCHEPLHLCSCIIRMESEDDDVFEVHEMNKDSFMFKAESSDIAKQWFKHLGYHSRDLGGWRRRRNAMANIMMVK